MASEKSSAKKALSVIGNIFIWLFIVFAVVVTILAFAAQNKEGIPSIGGKVILTVQTPSMEPTFKAGDMIIGTKLDPEGAQSLKVGDIITFKTTEDINQNGQQDDLKTHRITEIVEEDGKVIGYYTKGDNNGQQDVDPDTGLPAVAYWENIVCQHTESRIAGVGAALDFLHTSNGFLFCVVVPLILFFIFELISFIRKFLALKNDGKKQISAADEEEIKQRAVAEYLKQQAEKEAAEAAADSGQQAADSEEAPAEEAAEAPAEEAPVEEAPAAEAPAEEAPAEEAPVEEAPAEEAPAAEAPAETTEETAGEAPAEAPEEASSEETKTEE